MEFVQRGSSVAFLADLRLATVELNSTNPITINTAVTSGSKPDFIDDKGPQQYHKEGRLNVSDRPLWFTAISFFDIPDV